jgi:hypothetical protein
MFMPTRSLLRQIRLLALIACLILIFSGCSSLSYVHGAKEDSSGLWMAALKGIGGHVYYVGSDGEFSYFRVGTVFCDRYKAKTAKIKLPRTFPFGKEKPYLVTEDMVPKY